MSGVLSGKTLFGKKHTTLFSDANDSHLLVTHPSKSAALESFVLKRARDSTHITLMTMWFMQAYLQDLTVVSRDSQAFAICERVVQQCHQYIFEEVPVESLQLTFSHPEGDAASFVKLPAHLSAGLVGIGAMLAGAPGAPWLTPVIGDMAIKQGRYGDGRQRRHRFKRAEDDVTSSDAGSDTTRPTEVSSPMQTFNRLEDSDSDDVVTALSDSNTHMNRNLSSWEKRDHIPKVSAPTTLRRFHFSAAQTNPSLPLPPQSTSGSKSMDLRVPDDRKSPHMSSPSLPITTSLSSDPSQGYTSNQYSISSQTNLLRKHFLQTEVHLMLTLENISNKLLLIPKPARVSALRAQLTALNHQLPTECCIPLWCQSSDAIVNHIDSEPHHRVVRIPAGECVVLNSAERAPYLLLIEFLDGALTFDPLQRVNRDILTKLTGHKVISTNSEGFSMPTIRQFPPHINDSTPITPQFTTASDMNLEEMEVSTFPLEEEIDVVEQVYGGDRLNLIDDIELYEHAIPIPPKNRDIEAAAWSSKSNSNRSNGEISPRLTGSKRFGGATRGAQPTDDGVAALSKSSALKGLNSLTLEEYADRMSAAAAMLSQLNAVLTGESTSTSGTPAPNTPQSSTGRWSWVTPSVWSPSGTLHSEAENSSPGPAEQRNIVVAFPTGTRLPRADAEAIRDRIMQEMNALEEERMRRMRIGENEMSLSGTYGFNKTKGSRDEDIIRRELKKDDPSAAIFSESWQVKKSRIRAASPYGHLANWSCVSVIVKTGGDLRQEQLATQLIREFARIWEEEHCRCFVRPFHVLITGPSSGLVETIVDAVSIHSIKKAMYAGRLSSGGLEQVTLLDHFVAAFGETHTAKFLRAQRNFAQSLAGYSLVTYFLQIKDRHNGNILLDSEGRLIHIDFGFMLSNSPGNLGFEAAPFKLPLEYIEVLGGVEGNSFKEFQQQFHAGFEAARKHSQRIITLVELMQRDSSLPCFAAFGDQTSVHLRDRFQPHSSSVGDYVDKLIISSIGSAWTRLYDTYQYYSQSIF